MLCPKGVINTPYMITSAMCYTQQKLFNTYSIHTIFNPCKMLFTKGVIITMCIDNSCYVLQKAINNFNNTSYDIKVKLLNNTGLFYYLTGFT